MATTSTNELDDKTFAPEDTTAVLFHKGCTDGFAAAWVVHLLLGPKPVFYHAVAYGDEPPWEHLKDKNVLVVDFSWPRDITLELKRHVKGFVMLDHHKSSQAEMRDIVGCKFDMNECGATLAWQFVYPDSARPRPEVLRRVPEVLRYVRDRDLWLFELPNSRAFSAGLYVDLPCTFNAWDAAFVEGELDLTIDYIHLTMSALIESGHHYMKMKDHLIKPLAAWADEKFWMGFPCRIVQVSPRSLRSEVGEAILALHPKTAVAICWTYDFRAKIHKVSLRSRNGGVDVSAIAEMFSNGGGHAAAAGFDIDLQGCSIEALFVGVVEE